MNASTDSIQLGLEDLLGDLQYARRSGDLGRLATLAYFEVRRWARQAGELSLADHASQLITHSPHTSRDQFIDQIDQLIGELQQAHRRLLQEPSALEG